MPTFSFWLLLGFHLPAVFSERRRAQENCSTMFMNSCEVKDSRASCDFTWGGSGVYKCDENGSWLPENSVRTCGPVVDTAGLLAASDCENAIEGDICEVSCRAGYVGQASDYICQGGTWMFIDSPLECVPITCPTHTYLTYAESECTDLIFESKCTATCESGYVGTSKEYVCDENGTWQPVEGHIACSPVHCGSQLSDTEATCDGPTQYGQAACRFQCDHSENSQLYVCMQTGNWFPIGEPLDCRYCPPFPSLFNGTFAQTSCWNTAVGTTCSASCTNGFQGDQRQYVCSDAGQWEPIDEPLICASSCGSVIGPFSSASSICTIDGTYVHNSFTLPQCGSSPTTSITTEAPINSSNESSSSSAFSNTIFIVVLCIAAFTVGLFIGCYSQLGKSGKSAKDTYISGGRIPEDDEDTKVVSRELTRLPPCNVKINSSQEVKREPMTMTKSDSTRSWQI